MLNQLLKATEFWGELAAVGVEHVLFFQTDSLLVHGNVEPFLQVRFVLLFDLVLCLLLLLLLRCCTAVLFCSAAAAAAVAALPTLPCYPALSCPAPLLHPAHLIPPLLLPSLWLCCVFCSMTMWVHPGTSKMSGGDLRKLPCPKVLAMAASPCGGWPPWRA